MVLVLAILLGLASGGALTLCYTIGGLVVDTIGWRWCFFVGIPVAALAFVVLQKTLHLAVVKREVHIDYLGATLLVAGVSFLLVWISLAGQHFDWISTTSGLLVGAGVLVLAAAVYVEMRIAREPVIPGGRADIRERSALVGLHLLRMLLGGAEPPL